MKISTLLSRALPLFLASNAAFFAGTPSSQAVLFQANAEKDCQSLLSNPEELALLAALTRINQDFFAGKLAPLDRDQSVNRLILDFNPSNQSGKNGFIKGLISSSNSLSIPGYLSRIVLDRMAGKTLLDKDRDIVVGLGIKPEKTEQYLDELIKQYGRYFKSLDQHHVVFAPSEGWIIKEQVNAMDLAKDPLFLTAAALFISPIFAQNISDSERIEAMVVGNWVYLPPLQKNAANTQGNVRIMSFSRYKAAVKSHLYKFQSELQSFLESSKKASNFWQISTRGLYASEQTEKTVAEEQKDAAYANLLFEQKYLTHVLGVNKALRDQAADILIAANSIDGSNFERVEKQLAMASKAVMALPAIPVLIYVAPIAGGLIGLSTLVTQATIAIPVSMLIMATGKSAVDATMDTKYLGGGWFCNFANESIDQVPEALYKATRVMWIPSAAALLASTPIGLGTLVGEPGVTIVAAKAGPLVYRAINLTVAYAFTARAVYAGFEARSKCVAALDQIKNADFSKETPEVIDAELTNAEKTCLSASIDLGFALWGTKRTFSDSSKLSKMAIRKNVTK